MAAVYDEQNKKEGKGFAGISSLVTDIDKLLPPTARRETPVEISAAKAEPERQNVQSNSKPEEPKSERQPYQDPPKKSSELSGGMAVFAVAVVLGLLWFLAEIGNRSSEQTSNQVPASASSLPAPKNAPSYSSASQQSPVSSRPEESKPPVEHNLVYSTAQIMYCLAEEIRIDGAEEVINRYRDAEVNQFNAMVADYNSRCGSFRYRSGTLESAQRQIQPYRSQLLEEGKNRFSRKSATGATLSMQAPNKTTLPALTNSSIDATLQAIQRELNVLGYNAGLADGVMGKQTRAAIKSFQKDNDLVADGIPTKDLFHILSSNRHSPKKQESTITSVNSFSHHAPSKIEQGSNPTNRIPKNAKLNYLGNDWECRPGYYRYSNECREVSVPQNGKLTYLGNDWECKPGYFRSSNACRKVSVPQNGKLTYLGNDWECKPGYFRYGNACRKVPVPRNGKLTYLGNDWECKPGYFRYGDECRAVKIPRNGKLTYLGNDWECNRGYYRVSDECRAVQLPRNGKLTYLGNDWECERGYRRLGEKCVSVFDR